MSKYFIISIISKLFISIPPIPQVFCLSLGVCAPPSMCSSGGKMGKVAVCKSGQASCNHYTDKTRILFSFKLNGI